MSTALEQPEAIAIVGMSCRFPGARSPDEFWRNLAQGVESVSFFTDQELLESNVDPALLRNPQYVRARAILPEIEYFDAAFFGFTAKEAEITDPQHRIFLECAWTALEDAGCDPAGYAGTIGIYAGTGVNGYLMNNLIASGRLPEGVGGFQVLIGNDKDYLVSRVSYKLNLNGPSIAVQTACSTSLVAVHLASESLLNGECDMALAGGISISVPQKTGYLYQEGGIASPDGHCRAFDASAQGAIFGAGAGVVVLKRLSDALEAGDHIYAVIKGSAVNNDGALKVGFTAPSVEGQAQVIAGALSIAQIDPATISYVEAHGTATPLGDPIEIAALTEVFRARTDACGFCAIGSVKTNIGHLDTAAGIAGLIKTVLALEHRQIPPSLHFRTPNPKIDFAQSPFYVNTVLREWPAGATPRRAGVSSFGIGGTNAHVIVEEAPPRAPHAAARALQLLPLSARTPAALEAVAAQLADALARLPADELPEVAFTLARGRRAFSHRRVVLGCDLPSVCAALRGQDESKVFDGVAPASPPQLVFLLSGQGAQYAGMSAGLYAAEPLFRASVDRCAELLRPHLGLDIRELLFGERAPTNDESEPSSIVIRHSSDRGNALEQTQYAQPALFVVEYALAQLWMSWGVRPTALLGHSLGEYVAATLAGVFSLDDALALVAARGGLMQQAPPGAMLSVELSPEAVASWLEGSGLSVAAVNGPQQVVLAGASAAVEQLQARLAQAGVGCRVLAAAQAFHTPDMAGAAAELAARVGKLRLAAPQVPVVSNVSGRWLTAAEATDPAYWQRHMLAPVQYAAGLATVLGDAGVLLEVGPGLVLSSLARRHPLRTPQHSVIASLRHANDQRSDMTCLLNALGQLWVAGVPIDWDAFYAGQQRQRLPLPTYPFERQRYWIDAPRRANRAPAEPAGMNKQPDIADWFYVPSWQRAALGPALPPGGAAERWLVFLDEGGVGARLVEHLERAGHTVVGLAAGTRFAQTGDRSYTIDPRCGSDYSDLLSALDARRLSPQVILHLWSATPERPTDFDTAQDRGFYSLIWLAQALGQPRRAAPLRMVVVTSGLCAVADGDTLDPARATILGACKVIPQEYPHIRCQVVDLAPAALAAPGTAPIELIAAECRAESPDPLVAHRDERWVQTFQPTRLEHAGDPPARLRRGGIYLIAGGLGESGLALAEYLARSAQATLVLTARSALPPREEWPAWLASHDDQDRTSRRIRGVCGIEAAGGRALIFCADIADQDAMRKLVAQVREQLGAINGVIHAAGSTAQAFATPIRDMSRAECARIFEPKVAGLAALEAALRGETLDFCLLLSSLTAVLGGLGGAAYTAANLFMDAFALKQRRAGNRAWMTVNCDYWLHRSPQEGGAASAAIGALAMSAEEGVEAIGRALALADAGQVIISTGALQPRIEQYIARKPPKAAESAIAAQDRPAGQPVRRPADRLEATLAEVWGKVLGITDVEHHANFFDLGGTSLSALQIAAEIASALGVQVTPINLFEAPTISALASFIRAQGGDAERAPARPRRAQRHAGRGDIAIIGMAGRFPGAQDIQQFWDNIVQGVESIRFFSDDELLAAGVDPAALTNPRYVKARPVLDDVERFDATFFGFNAREAEIMDPQHRLFLECAWQALEDAGYDAERYDGAIGVFGGSSISSYLFNLFSDPEIIKTAGAFQSQIGNERDYLTTVVSYKLNLTGPSVNVQTFCSTSLVAVHMARQSLLNGECDMALAGAASVNLPQEVGYFYTEGFSADGHCRAFDAGAQGMIMGGGVAALVLKRLDRALADRDQIYAVIKGSAINNDGSLKAGYTAPSVDGQAKVIVEALESAGVVADEIGYVEMHGSGTTLGDPIEVSALTKAFQATAPPARKQFCAIGSVKTNVGHADRAAGVAGLIKTALALKHRVLPPSLNFERPNPQIDFANSPFYVNVRLADWPDGPAPRRAGVTALGLGGTNAHVVLEEAPETGLAGGAPSRPWQLLLLSAKTPSALDLATANLGAHLQAHPEQALADIAYTLQVGRRELRCRRALVCRDRAEAIQALTTPGSPSLLTGVARAATPVAFMFPGVGDHYPGMARDLYQGEPVFRAVIDRCAGLLEPLLGLDLRTILYPDAPAAGRANGIDLRHMLGRGGAPDPAAQQLNQTALSHPALFVVEYALAQLWISWGVQPSALLGYSVGEYVAACLAGVLSLEDALRLVAERAAMIQELPRGAMLAVLLAEKALLPLLGEHISLAAVNSPSLCVVAGPAEAIAGLERRLAEQGVVCKHVPATHAFHSAMMRPLAERFGALVRSVERRAPRIPYLSNVTGTWVTAAEAQDPGYWVSHMCLPVRFADAVAQLWQVPDQVLLEVGPGQALSSLALQHPACTPDAERLAVPSLRAAYDQQPDLALLLRTLGRLWLAGLPVDWSRFHADEQRSRVALPTYPFERQRYWIDARPATNGGAARAAPEARRDLADWFYAPVWKQAVSPASADHGAADEAPCWLVFVDSCGVGARVVERLRRAGADVVCVAAGDELRREGAAGYTLNPKRPDEYLALLREVGARKAARYVLLHLWSVTPAEQEQPAAERLRRAGDLGFYSLIYLAQALGNQRDAPPVQLGIISNNLYDVVGSERLCPEKTLILGPSRVIPQEYAQISCRCIDIELPATEPQRDRLAELLLAEFETPSPDLASIAYRAGRRWVQSFEPVRLDSGASGAAPLREGGVYLITGGLGGIGLALAEHLATAWRARLALVGRGALPPRETWPEWLAGESGQAQVRERIEKIRALEASEAELLVLSADVTDAQQLAAAVAQAHERFGPINGVFHAAGVPGSGLVQVKLPDAAAAVLAPKVSGTLALQAALRDDPLDFMVLFSSNTAVTGGLGQVDYCAANAFMDAFAHANGAGPPVIAVDWGAWQWDSWQDSLKALNADLQARIHERRQRYGISFAEGMQALERILRARLPQVVVSTTDFQAAIAQHVEFTRSSLLAGLDQAPRQSSHPRPLLGTAFVAPRNDLELQIATIMQLLLGIEPIGVHDSFFELGGHSLLAIQMISRLRDCFQIELPLQRVFEAANVANIAALVEQVLVEELENMSEAMAEQILSGHRSA